MTWLTALPLVGDLFKGASGAVTQVAHVWREDAEAGAEREHEERLALTQQDMASLQQFAAEFSAQRSGWWAGFVDGLNRLPRPLMTFAILALFVLAPVAPARFLEIARAYEAMPEGFWALLSLIVAFYFGGRMQLKSQDFKLTAAQLALAHKVVEARKPHPVVVAAVARNPVVAEWLRRQYVR